MASTSQATQKDFKAGFEKLCNAINKSGFQKIPNFPEGCQDFVVFVESEYDPKLQDQLEAALKHAKAGGIVRRVNSDDLNCPFGTLGGYHIGLKSRADAVALTTAIGNAELTCNIKWDNKAS